MILRRFVGLVAACLLAGASVPLQPPQGAIVLRHGPSAAVCCGTMSCCASGTGCASGACASERVVAPAAGTGADGPRLGAGCGGGAPGIEPGSFDSATLVASVEAGRRAGPSDRKGDGSKVPRPASMRTHDPPPRG